MPFINGEATANEQWSKVGKILDTEAVYRCSSDVSAREPFKNALREVDGVIHRTSFLNKIFLVQDGSFP